MSPGFRFSCLIYDSPYMPSPSNCESADRFLPLSAVRRNTRFVLLPIHRFDRSFLPDNLLGFSPRFLLWQQELRLCEDLVLQNQILYSRIPRCNSCASSPICIFIIVYFLSMFPPFLCLSLSHSSSARFSAASHGPNSFSSSSPSSCCARICSSSFTKTLS